MSFYYVKTGGTAGNTNQGRYAVENTGSFANALSNDWGTQGLAAAVDYYYDNLNEVLGISGGTGTDPVNGDFIYVSDAHTHTYAGANTYGGPTTAGIPLAVISVSDTAVDASSAGASENITAGSNDLVFDGRWYFSGMTFSPTSDFQIGLDDNVTFEDGVITLPGPNDRIQLPSSGAILEIRNSTINFNNDSAFMEIGNAGAIRMVNVVCASTATPTRLLNNSASSGGMSFKAYGCDFSIFTTYLLENTGGVVTDEHIDIVLDRCQVNSGVTPVEETFVNLNNTFLMTNCSGTSSAADHQFYQRTMAGDVEDDTTIIRNETTVFADSSAKVSFKIITNATCTRVNPLIFDLPARFAALATATTDTMRFYFAITNATALTDANCWTEVIYPDGTNKHVFNNANNRNADILATGTTHTDDSGSSTWKDGGGDLASHNEYRMDVATSGDVGADSVPIIRFYLAVASTTVYVDTTVDVVA